MVNDIIHFYRLGSGVFVQKDSAKGTILLEYTSKKIDVKVAEDKLDENVADGIGCYIVFVSNHDGKCLVEHA